MSHLDVRGSVKKLLNSSKITKTHQIYYWISYTKNQGFQKTPLFYVDFTKNKFSDINFWWILINFFLNLKRISPSFHFSRLKRPGTRSLPLSSKSTYYIAINFFKRTANCAIGGIRDLGHIRESGDFIAAIGLFSGVREVSAVPAAPAGDAPQPLRPRASPLWPLAATPDTEWAVKLPWMADHRRG